MTRSTSFSRLPSLRPIASATEAKLPRKPGNTDTKTPTGIHIRSATDESATDDVGVEDAPDRSAEEAIYQIAQDFCESIVEAASKEPANKEPEVPAALQGGLAVARVLYDQAKQSTSEKDRSAAREWLQAHADVLKAERTFKYSDVPGFSDLTAAQQRFAMRENAALGFAARHADSAQPSVPAVMPQSANPAATKLQQLRVSEMRTREALMRSTEGLSQVASRDDKVFSLPMRVELHQKLMAKLDRIGQEIQQEIDDPHPPLEVLADSYRKLVAETSEADQSVAKKWLETHPELGHQYSEAVLDSIVSLAGFSSLTKPQRQFASIHQSHLLATNEIRTIENRSAAVEARQGQKR